MTQTYKIPLRVTTILITLVGIIANSLSLAFFIKKQNKGLGNRLLILLNCCDLLVCISALMAFSSPWALSDDGYKNEAAKIVYLTSTFIYALSLDCTGFSTCLISVTRTIKVCRPFFHIKSKWLVVSFVFYFLCSFTREIIGYTNFIDGIKPIVDQKTFRYFYNIFFPSLTTANVIAVIISSLVTIYWLRNKDDFKDRNSKRSKQATVTVLILSVVYSVINALFVSGCLITFCFRKNIIQNSGNLWAFKEIVIGSTQSINSTANPIIYLVRKKEMRRFVSDVKKTVKDKIVSVVSERLSMIVNQPGSEIVPEPEIVEWNSRTILKPGTIKFPFERNTNTSGIQEPIFADQRHI